MIRKSELFNAKQSIKKKGYYIFKSFFTEQEIKKMEKIIYKQKIYKQGGFFNKKSSDAKIIFNLQSKNKYFLDLIENKTILELNRFFLNDENYKTITSSMPNYILSQFVARSSGNTECDVHIDDKVPSTSKMVNCLQWAIPLVNLSKQNGCTQILEGSHKSGKAVKANQKKRGFKDVIINKGDVAVWDGRIWHATRKNITKNDRWVIILTFARWFFKPHYDIPRNLPKKFYKYLNNNKKIILGFSSIPKSSEKMGVLQRGDIESANKFINAGIF